MIFWKRGEVNHLNSYFTTREFTCLCGVCVDQHISKELIEKLLAVRLALGEPIGVHAGFRCHAHQEALKALGYETALGVSQHELGNAADITATNMGSLLSACKQEFQAIGVANTFIHVDTRSDKPRAWSYVKR